VATQDAIGLLLAAPPGQATTVVFIVVTGAGLGVTLFCGGLADNVPVTVSSSRADLVASRWVASLRSGSSSRNALVDIGTSTFFSTKFVQSIDPADRSPHAGQILNAKHVTVETNTFCEQLNALLAELDPKKLSEALGAGAATSRGETFGQALADLNSFLPTTQPGISAVAHLTVSVTSCFNGGGHCSAVGGQIGAKPGARVTSIDHKDSDDGK
jgi:hypothetical protein